MLCGGSRVALCLVSLAVMTAAMVAGGGGGNLPRGVSERDLKARFKELARSMHPDVSGDPQAEARFQELTVEYARLRDECRSAKQREALEQSWLQLGGLGAAAALVLSLEPVVPATIATGIAISTAAERVPGILANRTSRKAEEAATAADAQQSAMRAGEEAARAALKRVAMASALHRYARDRAAVAAAAEDELQRFASQASAAAALAEETRRQRARARRRVLTRFWKRQEMLVRREEATLAAERASRRSASATADLGYATRRAAARRASSDAADVKAAHMAEAAEVALETADEKLDAAEAARVAMAQAKQVAAAAATTEQDLRAMARSFGGLGSAVGSLAEDLLATGLEGLSASLEKWSAARRGGGRRAAAAQCLEAEAEPSMAEPSDGAEEDVVEEAKQQDMDESISVEE